MERAVALREETKPLQNRVRVVWDQWGCPTYAPDLAEGVLEIASELIREPNRVYGKRYRGIFHYAGRGRTSWAEFAKEIFRYLAYLHAARGGKVPRVSGITSAGYPTPARRPKRSSLNCEKFEETFAKPIPHWSVSLFRCVYQLYHDEFLKKLL